MKPRRLLVVVLVLFAFAAPVWADDHAAAVDSLKTRAAQGEAWAQFNLGKMYYAGRGVPQDYAAALHWYRLAAAQEEASAQYNLGVMHDKGEGVPQDATAALKWYHLAAAQGNASAQFNLGKMYYAGRGVPQDYVQAHKWLTLAAATDTRNPDRDEAVKARDRVAARMTLAQIAEAQKRARAWTKQ